MTCPDCEHNKARAARWRAEAYKLTGHEVELPWVGLTDEELEPLCNEWRIVFGSWTYDFARAIEAKLKEKNT